MVCFEYALDYRTHFLFWDHKLIGYTQFDTYVFFSARHCSSSWCWLLCILFMECFWWQLRSRRLLSLSRKWIVIILALQFHQESLDILKIMCLLYVIYICEVEAIISSIFFSLVSTKCNIKATLHLPYLITANLFCHWLYIPGWDLTVLLLLCSCWTACIFLRMFILQQYCMFVICFPFYVTV